MEVARTGDGVVRVRGHARPHEGREVELVQVGDHAALGDEPTALCEHEQRQPRERRKGRTKRYILSPTTVVDAPWVRVSVSVSVEREGRAGRTHDELGRDVAGRLARGRREVGHGVHRCLLCQD